MSENLISCARVIGGLAVLTCIAAANAADVDAVRIVPDPGLQARTNMPARNDEATGLKATFDQSVSDRTNMQRESSEPANVTVSRDQGVVTRTNMGGPAVTAPSQPPATAAR